MHKKEIFKRCFGTQTSQILFVLLFSNDSRKHFVDFI